MHSSRSENKVLLFVPKINSTRKLCIPRPYFNIRYICETLNKIKRHRGKRCYEISTGQINECICIGKKQEICQSFSHKLRKCTLHSISPQANKFSLTCNLMARYKALQVVSSSNRIQLLTF